MSIALMQMVWSIELASGEKLVLLALADKANDDGKGCWPSVETICTMTGQGERTVRRALSELEKAKHITRSHREGTSTQYHVHPCQFGAPAKTAPLPKTTKTPANLAPKPSRTIIEEEAKASPSKRAPDRKGAEPFVRPEWADAVVWADFLSNRKRKRLPNTATAYRGFLADIAKLQTNEWPPPRLLEHAAMKGWGAIYAPDELKGTANGKDVRTGGGIPAKPALVDIGRQVAAELEARAVGTFGGH